MMMGRYKKFSTDRLGVSSYKRGIYILYKYYAGSTHTTWLVSFGLSTKKRYFLSLIPVLLVENSKKQPPLFFIQISTYHGFNKHEGWIKHSHCWEETCPEFCEKSNWDYWRTSENDTIGTWGKDSELNVQCGMF